MKFIELTLTGIAKKKVFLNPSTIGSFVCQGDFTGIGLTHGATMSVQETPEQVMQLINGNQKESGWVKHTGDTIPFSENKFVLIELESGVITFGDAISFNWKRNDKMKTLEERVEELENQVWRQKVQIAGLLAVSEKLISAFLQANGAIIKNLPQPKSDKSLIDSITDLL